MHRYSAGSGTLQQVSHTCAMQQVLYTGSNGIQTQGAMASKHREQRHPTTSNKSCIAWDRTHLKVVRFGEVAVEGSRVELGEDVDLVDTTVKAVGHGYVDEAVGSTDGYRGLGTRLCEGVQTRASPASEDDRCTPKRVNVKTVSF